MGQAIAFKHTRKYFEQKLIRVLTLIKISNKVLNMNSNESETFKTSLIEALVSHFEGATVRRFDNARATGLNLPGERIIWISHNHGKGLVHVSGLWPTSKRDNRNFSPSDVCGPRPESPSINISDKKSVDRIAADIKRRFLPAYEALLALVIKARDAHDNYLDSSNGLAARIASALDTVNRGQHGRGGSEQAERRFITINSTIHEFYGDIEASRDSANFEIRSVPAEKAVKLAEFLKTL